MTFCSQFDIFFTFQVLQEMYCVFRKFHFWRGGFQNQTWICQTYCRQNYRYYLLTAISNCNIYIIFYVTLFDISNPEPVKLNFRTILPSPFTSGKWFLTWCEAILKDQSVAKSEKKSIYTFQVYWQVHILKNQLQWKMRNVFCSSTI